MSDLLGVTDIMTNVVVIHNEFTAFCLLSGAYLTWTQLWTGVILSQCLAQPLAYIFIVLDVKLEVFFYNQINSQGITPAIFSFDLFVSSSEFNFLPLTLTMRLIHFAKIILNSWRKVVERKVTNKLNSFAGEKKTIGCNNALSLPM